MGNEFVVRNGLCVMGDGRIHDSRFRIQDSGFKIQDNYPVSCILYPVSVHSSRINHRSRITDHGFTLIELIVVIFIVSLFMAAVMPSFKGIESNGIRSEAKRIASILRYLNETAAARKEDLYLTVNFSDNSITYSTEKGEKKERFDYLRSIFLETKGEIDSGEVKVFFTPLGVGEFLGFYLAESGRENKVKGSSVLTVELNPLSGRVKIREDEIQG